MLIRTNDSRPRSQLAAQCLAVGVAVIAALALAAPGATADDKKPADDKAGQRYFEGESKDGKLQDALDSALSKLDMAMGEGGVSDGQASWSMAEVTGVRGGIAGFRSVKVKIAAKRTPPWGKN